MMIKKLKNYIILYYFYLNMLFSNTNYLLYHCLEIIHT